MGNDDKLICVDHRVSGWDVSWEEDFGYASENGGTALQTRGRIQNKSLD